MIKNIGFIGLGHMGAPMVKNLLKNNYSVKVYDVNRDTMKHLVANGAAQTDSAILACRDVDVVITMLQTGEQVKQVCLNEQGIFAHLKTTHTLFIDCSTIDVMSSKMLHDQAQSLGLSMVDAPVSGGVAGAEKGTLTFMVGGARADFERAKLILAMMGKKIIYAGKGGSGAAAKICNNLILGISMIAISEAFVLADHLGLAPEKLFEICSNSSAQCWSLTSYCPWPGIMPDVPASHDYRPGFAANMMLKDLKLSQLAATNVEIETPLGALATKLYQQFVDRDPADANEDFSAIIKMLKYS